MLRQKATGWAVAGITVIVAATTSVVVSAGPAAAATWSCTGVPHTVSRVCTAHTRPGAPLFISNILYRILPPNTAVTVTCWYRGSNPPFRSDGFEDHVRRGNIIPSSPGHIPNAYVNFGGNRPNSNAVALPQCLVPGATPH